MSITKEAYNKSNNLYSNPFKTKYFTFKVRNSHYALEQLFTKDVLNNSRSKETSLSTSGLPGELTIGRIHLAVNQQPILQFYQRYRGTV